MASFTLGLVMSLFSYSFSTRPALEPPELSQAILRFRLLGTASFGLLWPQLLKIVLRIRATMAAAVNADKALRGNTVFVSSTWKPGSDMSLLGIWRMFNFCEG